MFCRISKFYYKSIHYAELCTNAGLMSMGLACRLAGLDKWAFLEELAARKIERHYGECELEEDLGYARNHHQ